MTGNISSSGKRGGSDDSEKEYKAEELEEEGSRRSSWIGNLWKLLGYEPAGSEARDSSTSNRLRDRGEDSSNGISMYSGALHRQRSCGFVIRPDNCWYLAWTQFILIWAVYSSFFTPLEFGFFRGLPENLFLLDIAGQIAFLIDIVVRFFVAYLDTHSHCIVYDHKLIAIRYLKSRFLVDFLGCMPWDAIYKASGKNEAVRYLLWIRLSRALRVTEFFEKIEKDIRINYLFTRIVKLFVVELYCTHTAACIFYYLATTLPPSKEGYTWIGSLRMGDYSYSHFRDIDLWTRYITSLYFAIVTMATVGYGEIHAVNTKEMIFVMLYVSFDMILGAYLLGNMTALIVKGSKTERFRDKMEDIIKFTNRNKLGRHVRNEIKEHIKLQYESSYSKGAILEEIPISIRAKISQKLYEPYIRDFPLFKGCSLKFIKQMAIRVHEEIFLPDQVIIEQGDILDQLYFLCSGVLEEVGRSEGCETEESSLHLQAYCAIGEVNAFCGSPVQYQIRSCELSKVLRLDMQSFTELMQIYFSDGRIIVNNLLEGKEANLKSKILESDTALHIGKHESEMALRLKFAAYDGDIHRLKHLVGAGADPNKTDYDGRSPLHVAAFKGYENISEFLIQVGASINITDNFGTSPLLEAIKNGHDQVATLLVEAGAILSVDDAGNCLCAAVARKDFNFLRRLLENGINPNSKNYDLRTPLHLAASEGLFLIVNLLLQAGACVVSKDRWGKTPLDDAWINGDKKLIKLLEDAKDSQLSKLPDSFKEIQGEFQQKKCTVFPINPWDENKGKVPGVLLWVPQSIQELIKMGKELLNFPDASCILSEIGGRILDVNMIMDGQKLFLIRAAA